MTKLAESMLNSFLKGFALDANKKLKVLDEGEAKKAVDSLSKMVLEKSREYWDMLESAEGSLANLRDQISFEELNADPSRMTMSTPAANVATQAPAMADAAGASVDSLLGEAEDFNLGSIFEMNMEPTPMRGGQMMDAEGQEDVVDGDQDFEDMRIGADDAGMGGDDMSGDEGDLDALDGGDESMGDMGDQGDGFGDLQAGGEGDLGDEFGGDDLSMGGDLGGEGDLGDGMASDGLGDDEVRLNPEDDLDFDFGDFGDEGAEEEQKDESLGAF